jgi:hypothetical protein
MTAHVKRIVLRRCETFPFRRPADPRA